MVEMHSRLRLRVSVTYSHSYRLLYHRFIPFRVESIDSYRFVSNHRHIESNRQIASDTVYAAGLFNGPAGSRSEGDGDTRARIQPFVVTFKVSMGTLEPAGQALDVRRAMFMSRSRTTDGTLSVEECW